MGEVYTDENKTTTINTDKILNIIENKLLQNPHNTYNANNNKKCLINELRNNDIKLIHEPIKKNIELPHYLSTDGEIGITRPTKNITKKEIKALPNRKKTKKKSASI